MTDKTTEARGKTAYHVLREVKGGPDAAVYYEPVTANIAATNASDAFDPEKSPGMTDLMVAPESIDAYLAENPPPECENGCAIDADNPLLSDGYCEGCHDYPAG